jgi:hypothetical protein
MSRAVRDSHRRLLENYCTSQALVGREKPSELTTMVGFDNMAAWIGVHSLREATGFAGPNGSSPLARLYHGRHVRLLNRTLLDLKYLEECIHPNVERLSDCLNLYCLIYNPLLHLNSGNESPQSKTHSKDAMIQVAPTQAEQAFPL